MDSFFLVSEFIMSALLTMGIALVPELKQKVTLLLGLLSILTMLTLSMNLVDLPSSLGGMAAITSALGQLTANTADDAKLSVMDAMGGVLGWFFVQLLRTLFPHSFD